MKRLFCALLSIVVLAALPGCAAPVATAQEVKSAKARETSPQVDTAAIRTLAAANTAFALNLYQTMRSTESNLFFSPYSISEAMAMTYAGARGQTDTEMARALSFTLPQASLHPAFNRLDLELAKRGEGSKGKDGKGFRLHVVNAIWGQRDYKFLDPFLDTLATSYGAGLRLADFKNQTEPSREMINAWVSDQTEKRIKDLLPQGSVNPMTRLVLTNAIYFNAAWQLPFPKTATAPGPFHRLNDTDVTVSMMKQTASFRYVAGTGYQAAEMLYDGGELSMLVVLPQSGKFDEFEKSLDGPALQAMVNGLAAHQVALAMPKFEFESSLGLRQSLTKLGMGVAFTESADFSGMSGGQDLLIQDVLHKAFVSVDEEGTEAAAATAVIVGTTSMPPEPVTMTLDRPFLFLIRDNATGAVIFLGRVSDPTAK
jgi:serpin B